MLYKRCYCCAIPCSRPPWVQLSSFNTQPQTVKTIRYEWYENNLCADWMRYQGSTFDRPAPCQWVRFGGSEPIDSMWNSQPQKNERLIFFLLQISTAISEINNLGILEISLIHSSQVSSSTLINRPRISYLIKKYASLLTSVSNKVIKKTVCPKESTILLIALPGGWPKSRRSLLVWS